MNCEANEKIVSALTVNCVTLRRRLYDNFEKLGK